MPLIPNATITVTRPGAVTYGADGLPVTTAATTLTMSAAVQPLDSWRLMRMPEGLRAEEWIVVIVDDPLQGPRAGGQDPDLINYAGRTWQVHMVDAWPDGLIPQWTAYCYATQTQDDDA